MSGTTREAPGGRLRPMDDRTLAWIGRVFRMATWVGLGAFGLYIALRAIGATPHNFHQWKPLVSVLPMPTASAWIANLGIGLHFVMGTVLVLVWPILLSARIRIHHRSVHRWTGRMYVTAGFFAGAGGLSYILTHGTFSRAAAIAFRIWGAVMMFSAVMAFVHARAKQFDRHRAWAIRLFAMVLGSWLFDIEIQAWKDLAGGIGMHPDGASGPVDVAMLYAFFVPNLLVAEFFIRNMHRRLSLPGHAKWPAVAALAALALVFTYAIFMASATRDGKFGEHLLPIVGA
jgi:hypothetical protein